MEPCEEDFISGQEYEIPTDWGQIATQQPNVGNAFEASVSSIGDYSHLPLVIHRFQKPLTNSAAEFWSTASSMDVKGRLPDVLSSMNVIPEVRSLPLRSRNSTLEDSLVAKTPSQMITGSKLRRSEDQTSPNPTQTTKSMKENWHDEIVADGLSLNEHLTERFGRSNAFKESGRSSSPSGSRMTMKVNPAIRDYQRTADNLYDGYHWSGFREVPVATEVWSDDRQGHDEPVEIEPNNVVGSHSSINNYLERHYMLLREDAVAPLRNAVSEVQAYPHMLEKDSREDAHIYERVYITGFTFATSGIAARVSFSLKRLGKKVNWGQSKRLRTGSIVALTPTKDGFKTVCRIAVVAARPLQGLQQNPPEIDLFFGSADECEIDPQVEWIMVESQNGFYEGYRHTLRSLQMLAKETSARPSGGDNLNTASLFSHVIDLDQDIGPPRYVQQRPIRDLRPLFPENGEMGGDVLETDILGDWPKLASHLDESQLDALKRIVTKRLAIVQGPPGTGKTFISVAALNLMVHNMEASDPPIIIAAHTNHALDQLLRHISKFEPEFIRVGAMTTDIEIVKPRTLYEIKQAIKPNKMPGGLRTSAMSQLKKLTAELKEILGPLTYGKDVFSSALFKKYNVISEAQWASLIKGAKEWVSNDADPTTEEVALWLGEEKVDAGRRITPEDFGIDVEFEEIDLEFEQLKEIEAETRILDDDADFETLRGERSILKEPWAGRKISGTSDESIKDELKKKDMWDISANRRGPVYNRMAKMLKAAIRSQFCTTAQKYAEAAQNAKIGKWEVDFNYLRQARIIGLTTTGLSKYRGLIQSLCPRVVLIEEAAETLEGFVSAAFMKSVEHLILVGDHQQLRGRVSDQGLEGNPFYLDVSMFERLVRNHMDFTQLKRQRRMIPEIRRALNLIYDDLEDHESVTNRAAIPGMGGVNTFFFTHKAREENDSQMSKVNYSEADMIAAFYVYLNQNGTSPKDITVLTFYNGQRKLILRKLREQPMLRDEVFKVVTVDSYQGEENAVVLLSLVRSNEHRRIGFLVVENRVCVALSRAQRGFYIFGDAENLCKSSMLWWYVVKAMAQRPCRVGFHLPLTCTNHHNVTFVKESGDFAKLNGGCSTIVCREELPCGHACTLNCHPFSHDFYDCPKPCTRHLPCGHSCVQTCSSECKASCACNDTDVGNDVDIEESSVMHRPNTSSSQLFGTRANDNSQEPMWNFTNWTNPRPSEFSTNAKPYNDFAQGGHIESDRFIAKRAEKLREKQEMDRFDALFGDSSKPTRVEREQSPKVLRVGTDEHGATRTLYQERYRITQPAVKPRGDDKEKFDLLDL